MALWPEGGVVLVTLAAICSVICLLTIRTRFGIRPALRGLVSRGPYKVVRHPLYLSYLIADIGYNLQLSNPISLFLALTGWSAMVYRIIVEERIVARDASWPAYACVVRYRLIPAIW